MGRRIVALIVFLIFSSSSSITTRGSEISETCFGNCMTLLRKAFEIGDDKPCSNNTNTLNEERNFCNISCKSVLSSFGNDTVYSRTQNFVAATSSPLLSGSGYNFITLKWNTSVDVSGSIAFYILQVHLNSQSPENSLELRPSIPKYVMVKGSSTNLQSFTVENLVNGFDYRFRVAAIGWNGTMNSEYSNWSPWYSTNGDCNRTTGFIETGIFRKVKNRVDFPCSVSQITLTLSLKEVDKTPVVLDAYLNWKNPPRIHQLQNFLVRVTVKLLKQEDENIDTICAHYHDTDFQEEFTKRTKTSLNLLSDTNHDGSVGKQKKSIHFGCSYLVKFEAVGTTGPNSFESTTTFKIPECLQNNTSCPVPKESPITGTPGVITEKIFSYGNGNLSYAANISWNGEKWIKSHKIEFFYVTIEEKPNSNGGFHYSKDVLAKDGVTSYHAVSYNIPEGKRYKVVVYAYHGSNCVHDTVELKEFKIHQPCPQGCTENATCLPVDVFDGSAKCACKLGYTGNGTVCTVQKRCPQGCSANATCFPEDVFDGTAKCKCKDGYTGNGILCTVIVPKPCPQGCTANATCFPEHVFDGTARCKCKDGYTGDGLSCTVLEQKLCAQECSANATCFPEDVFDGTARCKCKDGYTGDGLSCTVLEQKPCAQECSANATCFPEDVFDGSAMCKCKDDYTGNGTLCTAIRLSEVVANEDEKETNVVAVVLPLTVIIALVAIILAFISWRIRRKKQLVLNAIEAHESAISPSTSNTNLYEHCPPRYNAAHTSSKVNEIEMDEKEVNVIYVPQEIQNAISDGLTDGYEFNADQIKFEECLGKGAFGYVHRAQALGITAEPEWSLVAVKTLTEPVTDKSVEDFIAEIELMKRVGDHENIIRMLGCCILTSPICLIMEYAPHGNLLTYLRTIKTKLLGNDSVKTNPLTEKLGLIECSPSEEKPAIEEESIHEMFFSGGSTSSGIEASKCQVQRLVETNTYLEPFALQIAKGMAYVAGRGIVHRDLAARNILIGNDYKLKISDFGLSKEGIYVKSTSGKIPLRWLSIEAIRERIYSSASDVWSYGIVLWEICTLGDFPYPTLSDRELLKFLVSGERLEKPSNCSDKMYAMMLECWQGEPEDRPTFAHLRDVLWKMNTGENPYINIEPMQDLENITTTVDGVDSIENSIVV